MISVTQIIKNWRTQKILAKNRRILILIDEISRRGCTNEKREDAVNFVGLIISQDTSRWLRDGLTIGIRIWRRD